MVHAFTNQLHGLQRMCSIGSFGGDKMARWRERAIREVRDELDRFLNYPINQKISLGDYGTYDGKRCRFEWLGNLSDLGVTPHSAGSQQEILETYATAGVVSIQGQLGLESSSPRTTISFRRASALAFRGYELGFDQVQLVSLNKALNEAIKSGLQWDRDWIIITQLWEAEGFTHLVSGSKTSIVQIEATAPTATPLFNFADPALGLNVLTQNAMSYCAVGQANLQPYFGVHKLRQITPDQWSLYKYSH